MKDIEEKLKIEREKERLLEKEKNDKFLFTLEWVIGVLSVLILLIPVTIGVVTPLEKTTTFLCTIVGFVPAFIGFCCALKIEQVAGYYECKHCGHKHVPTLRVVTLAMHIGRTRYMKCPVCKKKSWHKKVLKK